jgi:hypothetical protein
MSRYERSEYLETLCRLRAWYLTAPADDRCVTLSVEDAIAYGDVVMVALEADGHDMPAAALPAFEDLPASVSDPRD